MTIQFVNFIMNNCDPETHTIRYRKRYIKDWSGGTNIATGSARSGANLRRRRRSLNKSFLGSRGIYLPFSFRTDIHKFR